MGCEHVRAVLQGESPLVDTTDHLAVCDDCAMLAAQLEQLDVAAQALPLLRAPDRLLAATRAAMAAEVRLEAALDALSPPPVPADLLAATRDAVAMEAARAQPLPDNVVPLWRRGRIWAGLAAAAAVLLLVIPPETTPADPDSLIEKGGGGGAYTDLALSIAVQSGSSTARLRMDRRYAPGDVLYFRSSTDRASEVLLVRIDAAGAAVIHQEQVAAGEVDLPLSWTLESGEGDAIFALLASSEPIASARVESALSLTWPESPCAQAASLGLSCESVPVGLQEEAP